MMDRLEKRIDEKIDSKLGLVMEKISISTKSGPSSLSGNGGPAGQWYWIYTCSICSSLLGNQGLLRISRETHMA